MRRLPPARSIFGTATLLAFSVTLPGFVRSADSPPAPASACHDLNWEPGEWCGRDAYVATGRTEMNHDCRVDLLDFALFGQQYGTSGTGLSGDFDGSGQVNVLDFARFSQSWFNPAIVPGCTPGGMRADSCAGTIALSFNTDPTTIVSTRSQPAGDGTVYVVVDGWSGAHSIEFGIDTSSNVEILYGGIVPFLPVWSAEGTGGCNNSPQRIGRAYTHTGTTAWPAGPLLFTPITYRLLDDGPAWLRLAALPPSACYGHMRRLRWAERASDRSVDFAHVLNAGINGPAPRDSLGCAPPAGPCDRFTAFADDAEGWTPQDPSEVAIQHWPSGGHSAGWLGTTDLAGGGAWIKAPVSFGGDWRDLEGVGVVAFDQILIEDDGHSIVAPPIVDVRGPGGRATHAFRPLPAEGIWVRNSVPIDSLYWTLESGSWDELLADVREVLLNADQTYGFDVNGFDDIYVGVPAVSPDQDCNDNGVPDACDPDADGNGTPDDCLWTDTTVPRVAALEFAGHPIPFNPSVTLEFTLPERCPVALDIHDAAGRQVRQLVAKAQVPAGAHRRTWDGRDESGRSAASGVYFAVLRAGTERRTLRLVLLR